LEVLYVRQTAGFSTRAQIRVREATEADEPRILEIGNAIYPEYKPGWLTFERNVDA